MDYIRIVAFSPDSLRAFFCSETISFRYSTTIKLLPLIIHTVVLTPNYCPLLACATTRRGLHCEEKRSLSSKTVREDSGALARDNS